MNKTIRILIVCSVVFNVLLIGVIIGSFSDRLFRRDFPGRKPPELRLKLPPDKEKFLSDTMERVFRENEDVRKQMDAARQKVLSILEAPEFSETAYQAETAKLEKLRGAMMQRFADATKDLAKQFSQEERKALAEHLRQPPPPPPPHQEGPSPKAGPPPYGDAPPPHRESPP
jgi:uncharacterized membrane protein